jgi:hypothetical protein
MSTTGRGEQRWHESASGTEAHAEEAEALADMRASASKILTDR